MEQKNQTLPLTGERTSVKMQKNSSNVSLDYSEDMLFLGLAGKHTQKKIEESVTEEKKSTESKAEKMSKL